LRRRAEPTRRRRRAEPTRQWRRLEPIRRRRRTARLLGSLLPLRLQRLLPLQDFLIPVIHPAEGREILGQPGLCLVILGRGSTDLSNPVLQVVLVPEQIHLADPRQPFVAQHLVDRRRVGPRPGRREPTGEEAEHHPSGPS